MSFFTRGVDSALEASVFGSFTALGYHARKSMFAWEHLAPGCMQGRIVALSGATSGLGKVATVSLLKLGAQVVMIARDAAKAEALCTKLRAEITDASVSYVHADMGQLIDVKRIGGELKQTLPALDVLIHNAGALDASYAETAEHIEQTLATHVVGPCALTQALLPLLQAPSRTRPARVLWVASGGMYTEPLDVENLQSQAADFDGVKAYAKAKRAQVTLAAMMAERYADLRVHAMHPGWADTPGVARSLPTFRTLVGPMLRSPEQGADTLVWLAASDREPLQENGKFWLDRQARAAHRNTSTQRSDTPEARAHLWEYVEKLQTRGL
jgi:dehydrogenase/reductase SDR family member 12